MPDAFFQKKRKRTSSTNNASSSRAGPSRTKPSPRKGSSSSRKRNDDDSSDSDVPGGGIDDMDLTHRYDRDANSDDEADAAETPAEARVRLAKMYLQGLSSSNTAVAPSADGDGDDFFESESAPTFGLADAAQADRDNIAARLQKDVAEQSGKLHLFLADRLLVPSASSSSAREAAAAFSAEEQRDSASILAVRGHRLSVTCAIASSDAKWLFTGSKDGSIVRYRLRDGKMMRILPKRPSHFDQDGSALASSSSSAKSKSSGAARRRARLSKSTDTYLALQADQGHTDEIWTLSLSSDGQYLASAGKDRHVGIWRLSPTETFVSSLSGHKDSVTSLSFRSTSHELYTASLDRTLKLYDVSQMSYIETLFGHQESVLSLSCLSAETAVSAGGRDRTCRYWKIRDESQLVFRAGIRSKLRTVLEGGDLSASATTSSLSGPTEAMEGSVEVVCMLDTHHFVSGGDSGTLSLWNLGKKKPIFSVPVAHGFEVTQSETEGDIHTPRWITSLGAVSYSDVFVSGSWDGCIRVWGLTMAGGAVKGFRELGQLPAAGVVNSLQMLQPPLSTVAVVHQDVVESTAVVAAEYKRQLTTPGAANDEQHEPAAERTRLTRLQATKLNSPPIVIAALGKEHKFGRWIQQRHAKNQAVVIPLRLTLADDAAAAPAADAGVKPNGRLHGSNGQRFKLV